MLSRGNTREEKIEATWTENSSHHVYLPWFLGRKSQGPMNFRELGLGNVPEQGQNLLFGQEGEQRTKHSDELD